MQSVLYSHIKTLAGITSGEGAIKRGHEMKYFEAIDDAFLLVENGRIAAFGKNENAPEHADLVIDASGKFVLPAFCDSHTHLVFATPREQEFVQKINGLTYEQIAARGGGILHSARAIQDTPEETLLEAAFMRLEEIAKTGTGAVEIKSGYGLTYKGELKMLRVIKKLKEQSKLTIRATFLGAHAYPLAYQQNHSAYIAMLIEKLLPQIADEGLADFIDCFCEVNYFSVDEMKRIVEAGAKYGLPAKLHVNQFNVLGGVRAACELNALSVDHLEQLHDDDVAALQQCNTMPTALPGCSFFLNIPFAPARKIIDADLPLALASDYNPGSSPSGNMQLVTSLACIKMKLLPEEAFNATTLHTAFAMDVADDLGSIAIGKKANLLLTKAAPSLAFFPYSFGTNWLEQVNFHT